MTGPLSKVDMYVDLTYGALLLIGSGSIVFFNSNLPAVTFGVGVLLSYAVHVGFRMARFDPETETRIEETVGDVVEDGVSDIEETVEDRVSDLEESVDSVNEAVDAVEDDISDIQSNDTDS